MQIQPPKWLVKWIVNFAKKRDAKRPFGHIYDESGSLYMERYVIVPFDCKWTAKLAVRVHIIHQSDRDPHFHDHPWSNLSWIIDGPGYWEHTPEPDPMDIFGQCIRCERRFRGEFVKRSHTDRHRIELPHSRDVEPVTSLFFTGPYRHGWGFWVQETKVPWRLYKQLKLWNYLDDHEILTKLAAHDLVHRDGERGLL